MKDGKIKEVIKVCGAEEVPITPLSNHEEADARILGHQADGALEVLLLLDLMTLMSLFSWSIFPNIAECVRGLDEDWQSC